eukprot:180803_1
MYLHVAPRQGALGFSFRLEAMLNQHYFQFNGHYENMHLDSNYIRTIYHVRKFEALQMLQLTPERRDVFLTNDWPCNITRHGNSTALFRKKPQFRSQAMNGTLGSPAGEMVLNGLRPKHFFAAHMHVKFKATVRHSGGDLTTQFLALDKCLPGNEFLEIVDIPEYASGPHKLQYDAEWLAVFRDTYEYMNVGSGGMNRNSEKLLELRRFAPTDQKIAEILNLFGGDLTIP